MVALLQQVLKHSPEGVCLAPNLQVAACLNEREWASCIQPTPCTKAIIAAEPLPPALGIILAAVCRRQNVLCSQP